MKHYLLPAIILAMILFFGTLPSYGQQQPENTTPQTHNFTLQQCLDYAYENIPNLQKSKLDVKIAKLKVQETKAIGLPQVSAQIQMLGNPVIQTSFLPNFIAPATDGRLIQYGLITQSQVQPVSAAPLPAQFGTTYSGTAGLNATQLLFNGSYLVGLKASKTYTELATRNLQASKVGIAENVTKAYYSVLVARERVKLLENSSNRLDSSLRDVRALQKAGFAEKIDVTRLEVTKNNIMIEKNKVERLIELSQELLKFQMGMPSQDQIVISGTIRDLQVEAINLEGIKVDYDNRAEYALLKTSEQLTLLDVKNKQAANLPVLAAFGRYGYSLGTNDFSGIGNFQNNWFKFASIGLQLDVPIFSSFQRKSRVQQARLEVEKIRLDKKNLENAINLQVNQSKISYRNALETLDAQKKNLELAQEVVDVAKVKYKTGVGSNLEVITAESTYKDTETNYFGSLYDAIVAKVDLDKALGNLGK
jgi:outer membrane protein